MNFFKTKESHQAYAQPRVLVLILSSQDPINLRDELTQRETWATENSLCRVIWIRGYLSREEFFDSSTRTLYLPVEEGAVNILKKSVLAFDWAMRQPWKPDIVVRSNVSTYFEPTKLVADCRKLISSTSEPILAGYFDRHKEDYFKDSTKREFVSGAGIFLNRQSLELLKDIDFDLYRNIPDDVAISSYLLRSKAVPILFRRCNLNLTGLFWKASYIRLKSSVNSELASKRMKAICEYYREDNYCLRVTKRLKIYLNEIMYFLTQENRRERYFRLSIALLLNNARNRTIEFRYR